jgi:hypothetical protein
VLSYLGEEICAIDEEIESGKFKVRIINRVINLKR